MKNEFENAFSEITEFRQLPKELVLEALQTALISAYRRDTGASAAQRVEALVDQHTGRAKIFVEKEVVESVESPHTEVDLEKARYYQPEANLYDTVMVQVEGTTKKFGRIAAQTAKQVILQKIREAERNTVFEEYAAKEGELTIATVQSANSNFMTVTLNGRTEAIMPRAQQIPGERYTTHDKVRVYIMEVKKGNRGPSITVSRAHRNMLRRLLEYEVPEIYNGQIEIRNIAREPGHRSKVAVQTLVDNLDPVGACVGMGGGRIRNIVKELHDEKIDVIEWVPNQEEYIKKALSPARVDGVFLEDDPDNGRTATVIVPDDQLSLAIGREGQNARLAAKLTNWRIDIKSVTESVQDALNKINSPILEEINRRSAEIIAEVHRIMEKKLNNRVVTAEDYRVLSSFALLVERRLVQARESTRKERLEELNMVRATVPPATFKMTVDMLKLPQNYIEALEVLGSVGEIMTRFLIDEERLRQLLGPAGREKDALQRIQEALDVLVIPEISEQEAAEIVQQNQVIHAIDDQEIAPAGFGDEDLTLVRPAAKPNKANKQPVGKPTPTAAAPVAEPTTFTYDEDDSDLPKNKKDKKKGKNARRELVYDEDLDQMTAIRRSKRKNNRQSWDDYDKEGF
jgi:transcription termination/antitermination protein NusA